MLSIFRGLRIPPVHFLILSYFSLPWLRRYWRKKMPEPL